MSDEAMSTPAVVRDWIALQYAPVDSAEHERLFEVVDAVHDMTHRRPEEAWAFILAVLAADSSATIH